MIEARIVVAVYCISLFGLSLIIVYESAWHLLWVLAVVMALAYAKLRRYFLWRMTL